MITLMPNGATWTAAGELPAWMDIVAAYLLATPGFPASGVEIKLPNGWVYRLRRAGQGHEWVFVSKLDQPTGVITFDEEREIV